jgi:hypothetical protein
MSAQLEQLDSSTALAPAARAAIALDSAQHRKDLAELVLKSAGILAVSNADGREQAHRAGMVLKSARVTIQKRSKEAREDATAFSKAVIAEEKTLVDLIAPEEERILALRDKWDEKVEAERQAKIEAERQRVAGIQDRIEAIREHGTDVALICTTAAESAQMIALLEKIDVTLEIFQEFFETAEKTKADTLAGMRTVLQRREAQEAAAAQLKADQEAEAARIQAEREELARLHAEQEARLAEERREQEAKLAAERAEADRIRKLEDEARAFKLQREREAMERQNEAMRLERTRIAQEQAMLDESRRVAAEAEAERVRLQAAADQALEDARKPAPVVPVVQTAAVSRPSDDEIIQVVAKHFGVAVDQAYGWLIELSHELEYH